MTDRQIVHCHVHTEYSMLDGAARIRQLVGEAARLGMPALGITDHGVLYGLIDFYQACHEQGIKPILGCELYLARGSMTSKAAGDDSPKTIQHMTVLARNEAGYRNLLQIATDRSFNAVTIDDVGHYPMLEKPAEFNQKLRDVLKEFAAKR